MDKIQVNSGFADIHGARLYYEVAGEGQPFVMIHAGVADSRQWNNEFSYFAHRFRVFRYDLRGYGKSEGSPDEEGTYRDAEAAWRFVTEGRHIPPGEVVLFGRSLGAAIAAHLATRHTPGALIIESAFTSVHDLAAELYPFLPARWLARFRYSTQADLVSVLCPLLIVHSRDDEIIPFAHARRLFGVANEPKQLLELRGGHNDGFLVSRRTYMDGLHTFLEARLRRPNP